MRLAASRQADSDARQSAQVILEKNYCLLMLILNFFFFEKQQETIALFADEPSLRESLRRADGSKTYYF